MRVQQPTSSVWGEAEMLIPQLAWSSSGTTVPKMNYSVFMAPPASSRPQRPYNTPEELRDVAAVRSVSLKTLSRHGISRQGLPLDIHVASTTLEDDHAVYHVTMESVVSHHSWEVAYRYSEFLAFKNEIGNLHTCDSAKCAGSCQAIRDYMAECFPKKRLVGSTTTCAIDNRKKKLENVLLHLLRCVLLPGSAMKCLKARHALPQALFTFLRVDDEQDQRSLLQVYVDNQNARYSKSFASSSRRSSTASDDTDDEDAMSCHSEASTWELEPTDTQCVICLDDLNSENFPYSTSSVSSECGCDDTACKNSAHAVVTLPCHHAFHRECIFEWLLFEFHCPLCRARVGPNGVTNFCRPKGRVQWWLGEFDEDPLVAKAD
jgi:hypothetical protein